jgi:predicted  nucleic acid-binding Zn-ribbon protein
LEQLQENLTTSKTEFQDFKKEKLQTEEELRTAIQQLREDKLTIQSSCLDEKRNLEVEIKNLETDKNELEKTKSDTENELYVTSNELKEVNSQVHQLKVEADKLSREIEYKTYKLKNEFEEI